VAVTQTVTGARLTNFVVIDSQELKELHGLDEVAKPFAFD